MTADEVIGLLADKDAIRELTARYAHGVALGDGAAVVDLFTDEAVFETRTPNAVRQLPSILRGKDELRAFYAAVPAKQALPCVHDHVIDVDGDVAQAKSSVEIRLTLEGKSVIASGYYEDSFRREAGTWKFSARVCTFFHIVPLDRGWAAPAADT